MDRVIVAILDEAKDAGLRVSVDGNTLRIVGPKAGAAVAEKLLARKADVLAQFSNERGQEIRLRIDAFRPQVPPTGPIPFLVMTPSIERGRCLSCGGPPDDKYGTRCDLCSEAARRVIKEIDRHRLEGGDR